MASPWVKMYNPDKNQLSKLKMTELQLFENTAEDQKLEKRKQ